MSQLERILVGLFLAAACALLTFVLCWWTAAILHAHVPGVSLNAVIVTALTGLVAGIGLDVLFLRRWVLGFYTAGFGWMAAFHAALCVVAVASFMGLPIGTFGLGLLAGVYTGRREHHAAAELPVVRRRLRRTAAFAALLTAGTAFPIGLLALQDRTVVEQLRNTVRLNPEAVRGAVGILCVCVLCVVLFAAQYWGSLRTGWLAFRRGSCGARPASSKQAA